MLFYNINGKSLKVRPVYLLGAGVGGNESTSSYMSWEASVL